MILPEPASFIVNIERRRIDGDTELRRAYPSAILTGKRRAETDRRQLPAVLQLDPLALGHLVAY
jgi:hypothetical protein